jgi:hypothetical protein
VNAITDVLRAAIPQLLDLLVGAADSDDSD